MLDSILSLDELAHDGVHVAGLHVGQKTEMTAVDTQNGYVAVADDGGGGQERTVATHGNGKIDDLVLLRIFGCIRESRQVADIEFLAQFLRQ